MGSQEGFRGRLPGAPVLLFTVITTPIPNHHVRVVPATPQFQRKLELPLRVLLHVINNSEVLEGKQVVILWRTLTIMSPQKVRAFDEQATACARIHSFEDDGIFQGALEIGPDLVDAMQATPPAGATEATCWEHSWNTVAFGLQREIDLAEKGNFTEARRVGHFSKGDPYRKGPAPLDGPFHILI